MDFTGLRINKQNGELCRGVVTRILGHINKYPENENAKKRETSWWVMFRLLSIGISKLDALAEML